MLHMLRDVPGRINKNDIPRITVYIPVYRIYTVYKPYIEIGGPWFWVPGPPQAQKSVHKPTNSTLLLLCEDKPAEKGVIAYKLGNSLCSPIHLGYLHNISHR
jgi:hypothetical protein